MIELVNRQELAINSALFFTIFLALISYLLFKKSKGHYFFLAVIVIINFMTFSDYFKNKKLIEDHYIICGRIISLIIEGNENLIRVDYKYEIENNEYTSVSLYPESKTIGVLGKTFPVYVNGDDPALSWVELNKIDVDCTE